MQAESGGDGVERELAEVRRLLDALVERRFTQAFSGPEQQEFDRLSEREQAALRILAHRPASPESGPDAHGSPRS